MSKRAYPTWMGKGIMFFALAILFVGFLLSCGTPAQTGSQIKSSSTASRATSSTASKIKVRTLPTPSAQPINAAATNLNSTQVAIVDGVVYVGTVNNAFYALRANDGTMLWRTKIDGSVDEPAVVAGGTVYFSTYIGQSGPANVYALRASDGQQLWKYHAGNDYVSTPLVTNGLVYINAPDGVVALQASDGTQAWHFAAGSNTNISSIINDVLYLSSHEGDSGPGTAYALQASDGSLLWQYKSSKTLDPPQVINGVAYVGAWNGTLFALQASNGKSLWQTAISGSSLWMQQVNNVLYVATQKANYATALHTNSSSQALAASPLLQLLPSNRTMPQKQILTTLYALRISDGSTLWHYQLNNGTDSFVNWSEVDNGVIYGNENINPGNNVSQSYVYAIRGSDSTVLWKDQTNGSAGSAQLANGIIYATSGNSLQDETTLYALHASNGSLLWSYPIASESTNDPILVGNVLYVGGDNGMIYALSANNGKLLWHYQTDIGS